MSADSNNSNSGSKARSKRSKGRKNWDEFVAEHAEVDSDSYHDDLAKYQNYEGKERKSKRGRGKKVRSKHERGMDGKTWEEFASSEA